MAYPFECSVKLGVSNIEKPRLWEKTRSFFSQAFIKMRAAPPLQTKLLFEPLEPRILLSADLSFGAANDELTLRLVEDQGQEVFELIDTDSNVITSANRDNSDNLVNVSGSAISNLLNLDDSLIDAGITLNFSGDEGDDSVAGFELDNNWRITGSESSTLNDDFFFSGVESLIGGNLEDTLFGSEQDTTWNITGSDSGDVEGLNFFGFESLTGSADNEDIFIIHSGGGLSGGLDGGAGGFDTMEITGGQYDTATFVASGPNSGIVVLDGNTINYDGLEPINLGSTVSDIRLEFGVLTLASDDNALLTENAGVFTFESTDATPTFELVTFNSGFNSLFIDLGTGQDILNIEADLTMPGNFTAIAESITLAEGFEIESTAGDISLMAAADTTTGGDGTIDASVLIAGDISAVSGSVTIEAAADITDSKTNLGDYSYSALAMAEVKNSATVNAATLSVKARITGLFDATVTGASSGELNVDATHRTHALIDGGATVAVGSGAIDPGVENASLLIEAIDEGEIQTSIAANDPSITDIVTFADIASEITLSRDTQASIGDETNATTLPSPAGAAGLIALRALNRNGDNEGVQGHIESKLIGSHSNLITDNVVAFVENATIEAAGLEVSAGNTVSYLADAKVAENFVKGSQTDTNAPSVTKALINDSTVTGATGIQGVMVSARDQSSYKARSGDFDIDLAAFVASPLQLGKAAAFNEINKDVLAKVDNTTLGASNVNIDALNSSSLSANAQALVANDEGVDLSVVTFSLAGTLSANEVLGDVTASIENSDVTSNGDVIVSATNSSRIDATTEAGSKASNPISGAGSGAAAINAIGWDIADLQNEALDDELFDALLGSDLVVTETTADAMAFIKDSSMQAAGDVNVVALSNAQINATVSNAAESTASAVFGAESIAIGGLISSNRVSSAARANIENTTTRRTVQAGGDLTVRAEDNAGIFANAKVVTSSITTSDGGVSVLEDSINILTVLLGDGFITDGDSVVDTDGVPQGTNTTVNFGDRVLLTDDFPGGGTGAGTPGTLYEYLGTTASLNLRNTDYSNLDFWKEITATQLIPNGNNISRSDSVALGGLVVRNEVDGSAEAYIRNAVAITLDGDITIKAIENAQIKASADSASESSGGSLFGTGESIAFNAVIATNLVLSSAKAYVEDSTVNAGDADTSADDGNLVVEAANTSILDATNSSLTSTGADAVGAVLAFNTIGYESQNVLFSAVDALIGTDIGDQQPATVKAYIDNSDVTTAGNVVVSADMTATLNARLDNNATAAASAFFGASGFAANGILASNMVAVDVEAYIDNSEANSGEDINAGRGLLVAAKDQATIDSVTELVTSTSATNDLGIGILNNLAGTLLNEHQYSSKSGIQDLVFGDKVRLASDFTGSGTAETVYRYMGDAANGVNLATQNYDDFGFWQALDESNVIPGGIATALRTGFGISGGTSKSFYALAVRNDVDTDVKAFIDNASVVAGANVEIVALEAARITALENSVVTAGTGSKGGVIANNQLLSAANAYISDSDVNSSGNLSVEALNIAQLNATTLTKISGNESVSVVVAFNALGWDASNIFFNAIDTLLGTELLIKEQPAEAEAYILNSDIDADGNLMVTASSRDSLFDLSVDFALSSLGLDDASQGLDDAGDEDLDDEDDAQEDADFLEALRSAFANATVNSVELSEDLRITTLATGSEWLLDDANGSIYTLKKAGDVLMVSRTSLIDAQVGNEVVSNAKNDRVLVDALVTAGKSENKGKGFTELKYGSNGIAAGGVLATNRASTQVRAYIDNAGFDHTESETVDELLQDDRVQLAGGDIYEYIGDDQAVETQFDFLTLGQPDQLANGDRVRLHTDTGGGSEGDIYEYQGADRSTDFASYTVDITSANTAAELERGNLVRLSSDIDGAIAGEVYEYQGDTRTDVSLGSEDYTSIEWRRVGINLLAENFTSTDWTRVNAPLSINLSDAAQNYATNTTDWKLVTAVPAGTVNVGGNLTVSADDSIGIHADSEIEISSTVTNNVDAFLELAENLSQNEYDFTTKSGQQTVETNNRIRTAADFTGEADVVFEYIGTQPVNINFNTLAVADLTGVGSQTTAADWQRITGSVDLQDQFPNLGNLAESNSRAYGGLIVFNDVRAEVESFIKNTSVDAGGNVLAEALENATLLSNAQSNVSSSGGSAWGTGDSVAINGQIVSNVVLSKSNAYITDSIIGATNPIGGNLSVDAQNTSRIDATLNSQSSTGDKVVAVTLAFNTIGWQAQNVLFAAADAFVSGDPLVSQLFEGAEPAEVQAYIVNSDVDVAGDLSVTANGETLLNATVTNAADSAASALVDAGGKSIGGILASNKVNSFARAYIDNADAAAGEQINAGGNLTISGEDNAGIFANTKLISASSTSNDGGASVLQETLNDQLPADFRTDGATSQVRDLEFGDEIRLDDAFPDARGNPGSVYKYLGNATTGAGLDLATQDYTDLDFWKESFFSQIVPQGYNVTDSDSIAVGAMFAYNDVRGEVEAYIKDATVTAVADIAISAVENATIKASIDAAVSSSGGSVFGEGTSVAVNATVATNVVLSSAKAYITDSTVSASGSGANNDISIDAINTSLIDATAKSTTSTGDTGVGVLLAFNSVGWQPSNFLFNTLDALIGDPTVSSALNREQPARVEAFIQNSTVDAEGFLRINAQTSATINATTNNESESAASAFYNASGVAVGAIVTTNKVSSSTRAYIGVADFSSLDGTQRIETGDRVELASGAVYEYTGEEDVLDLAEGQQNYASNAAWTLVGTNAVMASNVTVKQNLEIDADDSATITSDNLLKALSSTSNDGGLSLVTDFVEALAKEYDFSTKTGTVNAVFGTTVRVASDHTAGGSEGEVYVYLPGDPLLISEIDLSAVDYATDDNWLLYSTDEGVDIKSFIPPGINLNVSESDSTAVGGLVVLNDVRGEVLSFIDDTTVGAADNVFLTATERATIEATNESIAKADGGSFFVDGGTTFAANISIATNAVLSSANAYVTDSHIGTESTPISQDIRIDALNDSQIRATMDAQTTAEGAGDSIGLGVTLAFNRIGVESTLLEIIDSLTASFDSLIGSFDDTLDPDIGTNLAADNPAEVLAYIENSEVHSDGGTVALEADLTATIHSTVENVVVASSVSLNDNTAVTVAALVAFNKMATRVESSVDEGSLIVASDVILTATDRSDIDSEVLAASVSIAAGVGGGISVSVGLSVALNEIDNQVQTFIRDSEVTTFGGLSLSAGEDASIRTSAVAAAIAISASISEGSTSFAGGGAVAVNTILGKANAFIAGSNIDAGSEGVDVVTVNASEIDAFIAAASGSVAIGLGGTSPAISIGISVALNKIGDDEEPVEVLAYLEDTQVVTGGALNLSAESTALIDATVLAASVAIAGSANSAVGLSGAGVFAENTIGLHVKSYIDGDGLNGISADSVSLNATDGSSIDAIAGAASLAGALAAGSAGVAVSIGLSLAFNEINNEVEAYIINADNGVSTTLGDVTLTATSQGQPLFDIDLSTASFTVADLDDAAIADEDDPDTDPTDEAAEDAAADTIIKDFVRTAFETGGHPLGTIDTIATTSKFTTSSGTQDLDFNDTVKLAPDYANGGDGGAVYSFLVPAGTDDVDLTQEDYSDTSRWERQIAEINLSTLEEGESWLLRSGDGSTFLIELDETGTTLNVSRTNINAISAAASAAFAVGSTFGGGISGAGAVARNVILGTTNAYIQDSIVSSINDVVLSADSTSTIAATVVAASAAIGGGGTAGVGASIGIGVALNHIGFDVDGNEVRDANGVQGAQVRAYIQDSAVSAAGDLVHSANADQTISALVLSGSAAIAAGGTAGVAASGSGVFVENKIGVAVQSFIDGDGVGTTVGISADSISLSAVDTSTISALAGAASLAASFAGTAAVSLSIGVSLARNTITSEVESYISNADDVVITNSGDIVLTADETATINAISAAASLSAAFSGVASVAVSGAGADAVNLIRGKTNAYVQSSELVSAGAVDLNATNSSSIDAFVIGASFAVSVGGTAGIGASIGVAVARNFLGWDIDTGAGATYTLEDEPTQLVAGDTVKLTEGVRAGDVYEYIGETVTEGSGDPVVEDINLQEQDYANIDLWRQVNLVKAVTEVQVYIQDSSVNAGGDLTADAISTQSIRANVFAASAALSGGLVGVSLSGAGASSTNIIATDIKAFIQGDGNSGIQAASVTLNADDSSNISSITAAASLAGGFGAVGVAVSIGVGLSFNEISNEVEAFISNADNGVTTTSGDVSLTATTQSLPLFDLTSITAAQLDNAATADPDNEDTAGTNEAIEDANGDKDILIALQSAFAAEGVILLGEPDSGDTDNPNSGELRLSAMAEGKGWVLTDLLGTTYFIRPDADTGVLKVSASSISAIAGAASLAVGIGLFGGALSGAGALSTNVILSKTNAYIQDSNISSAANVDLDASSTSTISSTVVTASLAAAVGAGAIGVSIGVSIANNFIGYDRDGNAVFDANGIQGAQVRAYIQDSSINSGGALTQDAMADQGISALVVSGSAAIAGGAIGVAGSGSGVDAENRIGVAVKAFIDGDGDSGISANSISLLADDRSAILSFAGAASLAASLGAFAGVSVAVGVSLASNTITSEVESYISNADNGVNTTVGDIILAANEDALITATSAAASIAAGFSLGGGIALTGAGATASNIILTQTKAFVQDSVLTSAGVVDLDALNRAKIDATILAFSAGVGAGFVGIAGAIGVARAENTSGALVQAEILDSSITAAGNLTLDAVSNQAIDATVLAGAFALAGGAIAGAGAGTGAIAFNTVFSEVRARIIGDGATGIQASGIGVTAQDTSEINAFTGAAAIAGSIGLGAISGSLSEAQAVNRVDNVVEAYIQNVDNSATATGSFNAISVRAEEAATITSTTAAAALAAGFGAAGISLSKAGAMALNEINNNTRAYVENSTLNSAGNVVVQADNTSTINALVQSAAASVSGGFIAVSGSIGSSSAINNIGSGENGSQVYAYIINSDVDAGGGLDVIATASETINAKVEGFAMALSVGAVALGAAGTGSTAVNTVSTDVRAYIENNTPDSSIRARGFFSSGPGLGITIRATDTSEINADVAAGTLAAKAGLFSGSVTIAKSVAQSNVNNQVHAYLRSSDSTSTVTSFSGLLVEARENVTGRTNARATSANEGFALIDIQSNSGGAEALFVDSSSTTAEVDQHNLVVSNDLVVLADGVSEAVADASLTNTTSSLLAFSAGGVTANVTLRPTVSAFIGSETNTPIDIQVGDFEFGGSVTVDATSSAQGDASAIGKAAGGLTNTGSSTSSVIIDEDVQSYIASNTSLRADSTVTVSATSAEEAGSVVLDDFFEPGDVNDANDSVDFPIALNDGERVILVAGNPIGGLEDGRTYNILSDSDGIRFGSRFDGSLVNDTRDTIAFDSAHLLSDGDQVVYQGDGLNLIDGLTDGATYTVKVIDPTTIKLLDGSEGVPTSFDESALDASTGTFNIAGHGFMLNQPVTYRSAGNFQFGAGFVDVRLDTNDGLVSEDNDQIFLGEHIFQTGDKVEYQSSDPIGGLSNGTTYEVIRISSEAIQLRAVGETDPIELDPSTADAKASQILKAVEIDGLNDGQTYYVVDVTSDSFKLAVTPGGTPLTDLDPSAAQGTHRLGTEAVDIAPSSGSHSVHLALDPSIGSGQQTLQGDGGIPLSLLTVATGDGRSQSQVTGSTGGVFGSANISSTIEVTPTVKAYIDATLVDAFNVDITSFASKDLVNLGNNSQGGAVSVGKVTTETKLDINSLAFIGQEVGDDIDATGVTIDAGNSFNLSANSTQKIFNNTTAKGGGFVDLSTALSGVDVDNNTRARFGDNAVVSAGSLLAANAGSDTNLDSITFADSRGFGADATANSNLFGDVITDVEVGNDANLKATSVALQSVVTRLRALADSDTYAAAFGADSDAGANTIFNSTAQVAVASGAIIRGDEGVDIRVRSENVSTRADARAECDCAFADTDSDATNNTNLTTRVDTAAGATIIAGPRNNAFTALHTSDDHDFLALFVEAESSNVSTTVRAESAKFFDLTDIGSSNQNNGSVNAPLTNWNADVEILNGVTPELIVNAAGNFFAENINASVSGNTIQVDSIVHEGPGQVLFEGTNTVQGNQSTFSFRQSYETVTINNNLADSILIINDLQVYNDGSAPDTRKPEVTIDVPNVSIEFDVAHSFEPTLLQIASTNASGFNDININGLIDNPVGTTRISNANGDIYSTNFEAGVGIVRTNKLEVDTPNGEIGGDDPGEFDRLRVELVRSADRPTSLIANASGDITMGIQGLLRDASVTDFVINADTIDADGFVDLLLLEGLNQTTATDGDYTIDVFETARVVSPSLVSVPPADSLTTPRTTEVTNHFRISTGPAAVPLGVFGTGSTGIETTYDFGLIESGRDIDIVGPDATLAPANVTGNTNIVQTIDFPLGNIDVVTNGDIDLTETEGDLRVGEFISTTGDVALGSAEGSIIDAPDNADIVNGDAGADATGNNVSFSAPNGGVGSETNVFQIDSSFSADGGVSGVVDEDIFITEVAGDLNLDDLVSDANVTLDAPDGSILEFGDDAGADVQGAQINLTAGDEFSIGESTNDLDIKLFGLLGGLLGDVNDDGIVSTLDLRAVRLAFGTQDGDENYNANADFNGDGIISTLDLRTVRLAFGNVADDALLGLNAQGATGVYITATEEELYVSNVESDGNVRLTVLDGTEEINDLIVASSDGTAGMISGLSVELNVGDDYELPEFANVSGETIVVNIDPVSGDADSFGGTATIVGESQSGGMTGLNGGADEDTFDITATQFSYNIDGGLPILPDQPGDTLLLTTSASATNTLSDADPSNGVITVTGLGTITYTSIETVDILGINDSPINVLPAGPFNTVENTSLTFSTGNGNAFLVLDGDAGTATNFLVSLNSVNGTLALANSTGLTVTGDGSTATPLALTGTRSAINSALSSGLIYTPDLDFDGTDTLTITSNDNGNSGTGGSLSDTDSIDITVAQALQAASQASNPVAENDVVLTDEVLAPIVNEALDRWSAILPDMDLTPDEVQIVIADLPNHMLGQTHNNTIRIDTTAAGYGWFVDQTPEDDSEFLAGTQTGHVANSRIDLLSVVTHELGHVLGLEHQGDFSVMANTLDVGERPLMMPADQTIIATQSLAGQAGDTSAEGNWVFDSITGDFIAYDNTEEKQESEHEYKPDNWIVLDSNDEQEERVLPASGLIDWK